MGGASPAYRCQSVGRPHWETREICNGPETNALALIWHPISGQGVFGNLNLCGHLTLRIPLILIAIYWTSLTTAAATGVEADSAETDTVVATDAEAGASMTIGAGVVATIAS